MLCVLYFLIEIQGIVTSNVVLIVVICLALYVLLKSMIKEIGKETTNTGVREY